MHKTRRFGEVETVMELCPDFPKNLRAPSEPCSQFSLLDESKEHPGTVTDLGDLQGSGLAEARSRGSLNPALQFCYQRTMGSGRRKEEEGWGG